jgi:hypothetical protein
MDAMPVSLDPTARFKPRVPDGNNPLGVKIDGLNKRSAVSAADAEKCTAVTPGVERRPASNRTAWVAISAAPGLQSRPPARIE